MEKEHFDILIVGVGGQGVLLASEIISEAAITAGMDVKKSEVHGMSQRGGIVTSHVRMAPKVYSPTIQQGMADIIMAFEQAEGLRALNWMRADGVAIVSTTALIPAIVTSTKEFEYPEDAIDQMKERADNVVVVEADRIAGELGNPRLVNTILLGVMSALLPIDREVWLETIKKKVKERFVEINLKAFERGEQIQRESVAS